MSYVRAVPSAQVKQIHSRPNDLDQETSYEMQPNWSENDPVTWPAYDPQTDAPGAEGAFKTVMLHYAINRPVGAQWGESDLAPALRWNVAAYLWFAGRFDRLEDALGQATALLMARSGEQLRRELAAAEA